MDQNTMTACDILGMPGRMISASKSMYFTSHPDNIVVFNANICTDDGKIWYGDINLTTEGKHIAELAKHIGETIYVFREMDCQFDNETKPKLDRAVTSFTKEGTERNDVQDLG